MGDYISIKPLNIGDIINFQNIMQPHSFKLQYSLLDIDLNSFLQTLHKDRHTNSILLSCLHFCIWHKIQLRYIEYNIQVFCKAYPQGILRHNYFYTCMRILRTIYTAILYIFDKDKHIQSKYFRHHSGNKLPDKLIHKSHYTNNNLMSSFYMSYKWNRIHSKDFGILHNISYWLHY